MVVVKDKAPVFDLLFSLMADYQADEDNPVTLYDIKEDLKDYSLSKLKPLASVLIDSLNNLAKGKEDMKEALENYEEKVGELSV